MIEFILGVALSGPFLIGLLLTGIFLEHNEWRRTAVFLAILSAVIAVNYYSVSLRDIAIYSGAYAVFGIVWSFYRYKRFVSTKVADYKERNVGKSVTQAGLQTMALAIHPAKNISKITGWIIVWPFSLIDNLTSDLINAVQTLIKTVFRSVYTRIYDKAMKDLVA